jgi:nucleoid-associated protein YgaU
MTLNTNSRYTTKTNGVDAAVIAMRKKTASVTYSNYVVKSSETFESIATRVYRDPSLYWKIADINPHVKFPDLIPLGTIIRIPS